MMSPLEFELEVFRNLVQRAARQRHQIETDLDSTVHSLSAIDEMSSKIGSVVALIDQGFAGVARMDADRGRADAVDDSLLAPLTTCIATLATSVEATAMHQWTQTLGTAYSLMAEDINAASVATGSTNDEIQGLIDTAVSESTEAAEAGVVETNGLEEQTIHLVDQMCSLASSEEEALLQHLQDSVEHVHAVVGDLQDRLSKNTLVSAIHDIEGGSGSFLSAIEGLSRHGVEAVRRIHDSAGSILDGMKTLTEVIEPIRPALDAVSSL
jgi:methyl-accepting chemotaxis protein